MNFVSRRPSPARIAAILPAALASALFLFASPPLLAQRPTPTIAITPDFLLAGGCTNPGAIVSIFANGTAANSDTFTVLVNGVLAYTWTGETMHWSPPPPGGAGTYGFYGLIGVYPANTVLTGVVTTYEGANPSASDPTTGQKAVYVASVSWNCTTGARVGAITNLDVRLGPAPVNSPGALFATAMSIGLAGLLWLRRRRKSIGQ